MGIIRQSIYGASSRFTVHVVVQTFTSLQRSPLTGTDAPAATPKKLQCYLLDEAHPHGGGWVVDELST